MGLQWTTLVKEPKSISLFEFFLKNLSNLNNQWSGKITMHLMGAFGHECLPIPDHLKGFVDNVTTRRDANCYEQNN